MTPANGDDAALPQTRIPAGVPGLELAHFPDWFEEDPALAIDGHWSVTLVSLDMAVQRVPFRTLHAAQHYARRIGSLVDWTTFTEKSLTSELSVQMGHAEAHAHEVDACWPPGSEIPFSNGPSIIDDDGLTRKQMAGAPSIDWEVDNDGVHRCPTCAADPVITFEWMGTPRAPGNPSQAVGS